MLIAQCFRRREHVDRVFRIRLRRVSDRDGRGWRAGRSRSGIAARPRDDAARSRSRRDGRRPSAPTRASSTWPIRTIRPGPGSTTAALETFSRKRVPATTLVVVDEAYHEYVTSRRDFRGTCSLLARYPNLIVTRTFSKAYALAGLRVGYAISASEVAAVLERLRESFNVQWSRAGRGRSCAGRSEPMSRGRSMESCRARMA